jgi:hypothetical protein
MEGGLVIRGRLVARKRQVTAKETGRWRAIGYKRRDWSLEGDR